MSTRLTYYRFSDRFFWTLRQTKFEINVVLSFVLNAKISAATPAGLSQNPWATRTRLSTGNRQRRRFGHRRLPRVSSAVTTPPAAHLLHAYLTLLLRTTFSVKVGSHCLTWSKVECTRLVYGYPLPTPSVTRGVFGCRHIPYSDTGSCKPNRFTVKDQ